MPYRGHVEDGVIVLDEPLAIEYGTAVDVEVTPRGTDAPEPLPNALYERYRPFIGALDGMPEDWAENHDKYLREQHGS